VDQPTVEQAAGGGADAAHDANGIPNDTASTMTRTQVRAVLNDIE
jgi:hypothetical protein